MSLVIQRILALVILLGLSSCGSPGDLIKNSPHNPVSLPVYPYADFYTNVYSLKGSIVFDTFDSPEDKMNGATDDTIMKKYRQLFVQSGWKVESATESFWGNKVEFQKGGASVSIEVRHGNISIAPPIFLSDEEQLAIPIYEGAKRVRERSIRGWTSFLVKEECGKVFQKYEETLKKDRWIITDPESESPFYSFTASKIGKPSYRVQIQGSGTKGYTHIGFERAGRVLADLQVESIEEPKPPGSYLVEVASPEALKHFEEIYSEKSFKVTQYGNTVEAVKGEDCIVARLTSENSGDSTKSNQEKHDSNKWYTRLVYEPNYQREPQVKRILPDSHGGSLSETAFLTGLPPIERIDRKKEDAPLTDLIACFENGHVYKPIDSMEKFENGILFIRGYEVTVRVADTGELMIPSGEIVACDPLMESEEKAFTRHVKPGRYRVLVSVEEGGRPVASKIVFGKGKVEKWELALQPTWHHEPGQLVGYGVDSGTGCFADSNALAALTREERDKLNKKINKAFFQNSEAGERSVKFVNLALKENSTNNLVAFESGPGDGVYPTWWGLDKHGTPLCLVTDFGMLNEELSVTVELELPEKGWQYLEHPLLKRFGKRVRAARGPDSKKDLFLEAVAYPSTQINDKKGNYCVPMRRRWVNRENGVTSEIIEFNEDIAPGTVVQINFAESGKPRR